MSLLLRKSGIISQAQLISRAVSTSPALSIKEWRVQRGLSVNRTAEGILTDTPDFTYLDGRPTPLLKKQKKRIQRNKDVATKIVELCSELDFAKERHESMLQAQEQERQNIIANRLKPKGVALYKKN